MYSNALQTIRRQFPMTEQMLFISQAAGQRFDGDALIVSYSAYSCNKNGTIATSAVLNI